VQDYASSAETSVATGKLVSQLLNFLSRMTAVAEPRVRLTTPSQVRKLLRLEASQLNIEVAMLLDTSAVIRADAYLNRTGEVRMHIDPLASPSWHLRPPLSGTKRFKCIAERALYIRYHLCVFCCSTSILMALCRASSVRHITGR
jgi:hypothetical protein